MSEQTIYGANTPGGSGPRTKIRTHHLQRWKADGHKWAMLTAYDYSTARIFDEAGIPVLLVGDSAANVVYGYDTTVPISIDELIPLVRGVVRGAPHALVVADLLDDSSGFMTEQDRHRPYPGAVDHRQVGVAHARSLDSDKDLTAVGRVQVQLDDADWFRPPIGPRHTDLV